MQSCTGHKQRKLDSCGSLSHSDRTHGTCETCYVDLPYAMVHLLEQPCTEERNGVARMTRRNDANAESVLTVPRFLTECALTLQSLFLARWLWLFEQYAWRCHDWCFYGTWLLCQRVS